MSMPLLELENYSCIRVDAPLFSPVNAALEKGQMLHVQATNGVGKTTLLRSIYGLSVETVGKLYWLGELVLQGLADKVIYINDRPGILPRLTVIEALEKMLLFSGQKVQQSDLKNALQEVGIVDCQIPSEGLSKGQRKRLHIARLLLIKRSLWLLDEPFDGLDKQGESLLQKIMVEHLSQSGSIMYTSHLEIKGRQPKYASKIVLRAEPFA